MNIDYKINGGYHILCNTSFFPVVSSLADAYDQSTSGWYTVAA